MEVETPVEYGVPTLDSGYSHPDPKPLEAELGFTDARTHIDDALDILESHKLDASSTERKEYEQRLFEDNVRATKPYRWQGQDELSQFRPGRIMTLSEFRQRLQRAGVNVHVAEVSIRGMIGLSVNYGDRLEYVCGVQPVMPEYSQLRIGRYGEPQGEKFRGWRTVLLRLIGGDHVTEESALKFFPPPTEQGSGPYLKELKALRERRK